MSSRVRTDVKGREPEPSNIRLYEPATYDHSISVSKRQRFGRVVVRGKDRPWDMHRQANSKRYLSPVEPELSDTVLQEWEVFLQWTPERSGRHRHQGGLVIFIIQGRGHTIMDGVRHDWQAGDLMLMPLVPGGFEHQHFNDDPQVPVKWIAFQYWPWFYHAGSEIAQLESCPWYEDYVKARNLAVQRDGDQSDD